MARVAVVLPPQETACAMQRLLNFHKPKVKKMIRILLYLLPILASAQSANVKLGLCVGTHPKLLMYVPTNIGTTQVSIPMCVILGAGLTLDMGAAGGPTLSAPVPVTPRMFMDTMAIPINTPASTLSLPFTLTKTPAPGTYLTIIFKSSAFGANAVDVVAASTKAVSIVLPLYRPFTVDDSVRFVYWTVEP